MEPSTDIAVIASRYQTVNTLFLFDGSTLQRILKANPRRWYVRFCPTNTTSLNVHPTPGPAFAPASLVTVPPLLIESKYKDCPSQCTGEWYAAGPGLTSVMISECIYLGES